MDNLTKLVRDEITRQYRSVRQFAFLIRHLTYIMQQSCTLGLLRVQSEFGCHDSAEVGCLAGVLQEVLSV